MPTETVNNENNAGNDGSSGQNRVDNDGSSVQDRDLELDAKLARNKSYSRKMVKKFFLLVGSIVSAFVLAASIGLYAYMKSTEASAEDLNVPVASTAPISDKEENLPEQEEAPEVSEATEAPIALLPIATAEPGEVHLIPAKTNFLIVGEDAGEMLTDVMLVGSFDRDTKEIKILSIPRDTRIEMPSSRVQQMRSLGLYPPSSGVMKMNAVHSYGGKKYGMILLRQQLEDLLGINIDYYLEINLKAFRDIVDAIGGVDMEIRSRGLYYEDKFQNLTIAVPGGMQHLDGKMAEGVVRFREDYSNGDLSRIEVQHEFLKQLFQQALSREHIIQNAYGIAKAIISYTKTDFGIGDLPKYVGFIGDLNPDNITFLTLPGVAVDTSPSYFIANNDEIAELVSLNFESGGRPNPKAETQLASAKSSKDAKIQVLNGAQLAGIASKYQEKLETDGYNVENIGNYTGSYKPYTRILVKEQGLGEDLAGYFSDPIITVENNMTDRFDIVIIIGKDEML
jgi:LCP family protein required for cell wall assembly